MYQVTRWYDSNNTTIIVVCGAILLLTCLKRDMQSQSNRNAPPPRNWTFQLNLNTATASELENLPQIGPTMAQRIVEFRRHLPNETFTSLRQLQHVRGIGDKTIITITPFLMLSHAE
jgi:competence ComEA-like helix-hairpin-helix protein